MKKAQQEAINNEVMAIIDAINEKCKNQTPLYIDRLDYCNASLIIYDGVTLLKSYNTIIAAYDYNSNVVIDFLRWIYGYTSTSAKHISKFKNRYRGADFKQWREV